MNRLGIIGILLLAIVLPTVAFAGTSGPSPIPAPPNFQISTNTLTLCKGMINNVPIAVHTPVGAAMMQSTQLSITNSKYTYTAGNGTVTSVNVTPNVTQIIHLPIFASLNSTPLITTGVTINYVYDTFYTDSEVRNISFGVETCPSTLNLAVSPMVLVSGKIENVTFNLSDTGNVPLRYISMHASVPSTDGTFLGTQPVEVSTIMPHASARLNESVFVYRNATQSFPINISVSMYNGTSIEQLSYNPIVLSTGIINLTPSSITVSPSPATAGSIFSISFVLTDVGTSEASAVSAAALSTKGFSTYGANSVFVGDMQIDTQTPVTVTMMSQSSVKNGTYTIPIRLSYLNGLRQNMSTVMYAPVTISGSALTYNSASARYVQARSGVGNALLIEIVLVIVIIVLLIMYYRQHRKHKQMSSKQVK